MSATESSNKKQTVHAGFMPLVDCAPLVIAKELGFADKEGLSLELHKETSWSNIRDKIIVGHFDCAHMLAPMPIAATLGLNHVRQPIITPLTLSLNGNAITVSTSLHAHMRDVASQISGPAKQSSAKVLAAVIEERKKKNFKPLAFGVVFPYSCQNYELRHWLNDAGIDLAHDVRLIGLPPSMMVETMQADQIDGFCAGEPWSSAAVHANAGAIVATKAEHWGLAPEKVLGVRLGWAEHATDALYGIVRAIVAAMDWLSDPAHIDDAATILSDTTYVPVDKDLIVQSITNRIRYAPGKPERATDAFLKFPQGTESCPSRVHMSWILHMMHQTGQLEGHLERAYVIDDVARVDLWEAITGHKAGDSTSADMAVAQAIGTAAREPKDILDALLTKA